MMLTEPTDAMLDDPLTRNHQWVDPDEEADERAELEDDSCGDY